VELRNCIPAVYAEERCVFNFSFMRYGCVARSHFVIKCCLDAGVGFL
jgi:hypothetical protein